MFIAIYVTGDWTFMFLLFSLQIRQASEICFISHLI